MAGTSLYEGLRQPCTVFSEMGSKRVCSADGRRWHWYRSHGATELSRKLPRRLVNQRHRRSTLNECCRPTWIGRFQRSSLVEQRTSVKAFADWWKRCLRSKCCCMSRSQLWFATKSHPLHRSRRQNDEAGAFLCAQCTRWETAGRPGRHTNAGTGVRTYGLAEISSTCVCVSTAWSRSVR